MGVRMFVNHVRDRVHDRREVRVDGGEDYGVDGTVQAARRRRFRQANVWQSQYVGCEYRISL